MHVLIQCCSESWPSLKESLKLTLSWVRGEGRTEQISRRCVQHQKQLKVFKSRAETHGASDRFLFCRETILKTISCSLWKIFPEVRATGRQAQTGRQADFRQVLSMSKGFSCSYPGPLLCNDSLYGDVSRLQLFEKHGFSSCLQFSCSSIEVSPNFKQFQHSP